MAVKISEICDGVALAIESGMSLQTVQSYDELTEGLNRGDLPLAQVYWEEIDWDSEFSTDRSTFGGGVRQKWITIHVDIYTTVRSTLSEDMRSVVISVDDLIDMLETQNTPPFFNVSGIKAFDIGNISRAIFEYASGTQANRYMGIRCTLHMAVY